MSNKDQIQRFIFEHANIRGQLTGLHESYLQATEHHDYPEPVQRLVGEFLAAAALLSTTIKFAGTLSIQAQGEGDLHLIMAECSNDRKVRAVARCKPEARAETLLELLGKTQLFITIEPDAGQRYQGIVPLTGNNLAQCIEHYFRQSEQLQTRIWLAARPGHGAAGLLLQQLPGKENSPISEPQAEDWERLCQLADTLREQELLELDNDAITHRLYHQEKFGLFAADALHFHCGCSRERMLQAMVALGSDEVEQLFEAQPVLAVKCEFCNRQYHLPKADLEPYLMENEIRDITLDLDPSRTLH